MEALSRGASFVTFVDSSVDCKKIIDKNLSDIDQNFTVLVLSVHDYITQSEKKFDIIFYDPPFSFLVNEINSDLNTIQNLMRKNSKLIIHRHKSSVQFVYPEGLELYKEKKYGQSNITILKK
jgi:N6-adenine-specific methylase